MPVSPTTSTVAVIGAGVSGAACAQGLLQAGRAVQLFDKSRGPGGRMATRRAQVQVPGRGLVEMAFDHGAPHFTARMPRFKAWVARAESAGVLRRGQPLVYSAWPAAPREVLVPHPSMTALCRHLIGDAPLHSGHAVQQLLQTATGWLLRTDDGQTHGPFSHVVLALPPAQAAPLLAPHQPRWAAALATTLMAPCWSLMAVTDEVDWPWDVVEPEHGPLARVLRSDRSPGRPAQPGLARWVAQADAAWSTAHLDASPEAVGSLLRNALQALLPGAAGTTWHHLAAHRWRYAQPLQATADGRAAWWDGDLGLGVCGDFLGQQGAVSLSGVEAAWHSGDELADTVQAELDQDLGHDAVAALPVTSPLPRLLAGRQRVPAAAARAAARVVQTGAGLPLAHSP